MIEGTRHPLFPEIEAALIHSFSANGSLKQQEAGARYIDPIETAYSLTRKALERAGVGVNEERKLIDLEGFTVRTRSGYQATTIVAANNSYPVDRLAFLFHSVGHLGMEPGKWGSRTIAIACEYRLRNRLPGKEQAVEYAVDLKAQEVLRRIISTSDVRLDLRGALETTSRVLQNHSHSLRKYFRLLVERHPDSFHP